MTVDDKCAEILQVPVKEFTTVMYNKHTPGEIGGRILCELFSSDSQTQEKAKLDYFKLKQTILH